ncbi:hypothetical protein DL767_000677 [Monosporascus sp. MG133]|nr:hypothetical protein DL767_000677 [Monosporascus sp. MG133]
MSLSFTANSLTLANWGFSAGDIATLAAAGRAAVTWATNNFKDRGLLEFMKVDAEDLVPRKGLIDPVALHKRWDVRMTLLQNGERVVIEGPSGPVVENMNIFSWFMTIITSAMDATLQRSSIKQAMSSFLTALFKEHVDELDYLQRELPHHIQGWISAAVVRNIISQARTVWHRLLDRELRLPGDIPKEDVPEIVRFLVWLAGANKQKECKRFETTSSDVFAFAIILESIGLDVIDAIGETEDEVEAIESRLVVKFTPGAIATGSTSDEEARSVLSRQRKCSGMRIPLQCMEECVSIWPGTADQNNQRRVLFKDGLTASETLCVTAYQSASNGKRPSPAYMLSDKTHRDIGRTDTAVYRIVSECFPIPTPALIDAISQILRQNPELHDRERLGIFRQLEENPESLSKVQVFVLGYYYGMLRKFLDDSKLSILEAYGSWRWFDARLLSRLRMVLSEYSGPIERGTSITAIHSGGAFLGQEGILKLLGMFFAGAEEDQLRALDKSAVGIHGKISVVANSLLGSINFKSSATHFCLLDTDPTAIPSNARGIISSGIQDSNIPKPLMLSDDHLQDIDKVDRKRIGEDFTSHIEPDWENDVQQCQIVFRYKGRLVGRMAPTTLEEVWTKVTTKKGPQMSQGPPSSAKVYVAEIDTLVYNCPQPDFGSEEFDPDQPSILIPTQAMTKARTFLLAHYCRTGYFRAELVDPWPEIGWNPERSGQVDSDLPIILYSDFSYCIPNEVLDTGRVIILA